jgi:hypothetical protein
VKNQIDIDIVLCEASLFQRQKMADFITKGSITRRGIDLPFLFLPSLFLLNIYYPGEWYLSFIRIFDVAIGGVIAVAMVYLSGSRLTQQHQ